VVGEIVREWRTWRWSEEGVNALGPAVPVPTPESLQLVVKALQALASSSPVDDEARAASTTVAGSAIGSDAPSSSRRSLVMAMQRAVVQPGALAVNVLQTAAMLGCGRTTVFALLKAKKLTEAKKNGRDRMVTVASIHALLDPTAGFSQKTTRASRAKATKTPSGAQLKSEILKLKRSA